ncbi:MAG: helix-turn-helix transcriptional regulator [Candidatus Gygaella obscura]|nr:helix-turn-helix transcriptional regulator [Candidatus Gygaella obscura]
MIHTNSWLWDKNITKEQAKEILLNSYHKDFINFASLLLSRENDPKIVFKEYLKPEIFLQDWAKIKKTMRKDSWNSPRIEFWQAVYEHVKKRFIDSGRYDSLLKKDKKSKNTAYKDIAEKIRSARKKQGITQVELAQKLSVSQQLISRMESGRDNVSIQTLKNVACALGVNLIVELA